MSINSYPLTQLVLTIDNLTNCSIDVAKMIVMYDIPDYKQLKLDLSNAMQDRVDRKLEWEKISHQHRNLIRVFHISDYNISTIIQGRIYEITFNNNRCFDDTVDEEEYDTDIPNSSVYFSTEIIYDDGFCANNVSTANYPRKSLHKLTKEELHTFGS